MEPEKTMRTRADKPDEIVERQDSPPTANSRRQRRILLIVENVSLACRQGVSHRAVRRYPGQRDAGHLLRHRSTVSPARQAADTRPARSVARAFRDPIWAARWNRLPRAALARAGQLP